MAEKETKSERIKRHLHKHKTAYLVTAAFGAGLIVRGRASEINWIIKPKNMMGLGYKSSQIMNTIVLPAKGDPGDVVQNIRTLETFPSKSELARHLDIPRVMVSRYFRGDLPHLLGEQFEVIGKAGHPIAM